MATAPDKYKKKDHKRKKKKKKKRLQLSVLTHDSPTNIELPLAAKKTEKCPLVSSALLLHSLKSTQFCNIPRKLSKFQLC